MRKPLLGISIAIITFMLGMGVVWALEQPTSIQFNPGFVETATTYLAHPLTPRFSPTGRGCGTGYSQGYETNDGQRLSEGVAGDVSQKSVKQRFRQQIRDAKQIIERVPNYPNDRGEIGERIVLVNKATDINEESVSILWYDGGDSYRYIDAPTLDLVLEFEQYLISIDFRSPM